MQYIFASGKIRKIILSALLFCALFSFLSLTAQAATGINRTIQFQGRVVNKTVGTNVTDGNYTFIFKIYDQSTGGSKLWGDETQNNVPVTSGIFTVALGSVRTFATDNLDFNQDNLWLDVTFNGENFGSRIRLTAVPYAFNAEKVNGLTVTQTTGVLTIPNTKTVSFADAFTTSGANPLTFTTTGTTSVTLPTSGILLSDAGAQTVAVSGGDTTVVDTFNLTNSASSGTTTANNLVLGLTGTDNASGANTLNALNFSDVTSHTNNTYNGLNFGAGYTNLLKSANFTVTSAGAMSGLSVALGTNPASAGTIRIPTASWIAARNNTNGADVNLIQSNASDQVAFGANLAAFTLGGAVTGNSQNITGVNGLGAATLTLGTNPAAAGTLRLPNATYITARNAANNADVNLVAIDASNLVSFGANTAAFTLGGAVTGNSQNITGLGSISGTSIALGTNPAAAGTLRLPNATYITARNAANNADINMIQVDASNNIALGANLAAHTLGGAITGNSQNITALGSLTINGGGSIEAATSGTLTIGNAANTTGLTLGKAGATTTFNSTSWTATPTISGLITDTTGIALGTTPAAAGILRIPNATYITARNAANNADVNLIQLDASNLVSFGANLAAHTLGGAITGNSQNITGLGSISGTSIALGTNPAAAGALRIPNATYITARNAANNADVNMIQVDASNNIALGANLAAHTLGGAITGNSQSISAISGLTINGGGSIEAATSGTLTIGGAANTTGLALAGNATTVSLGTSNTATTLSIGSGTGANVINIGTGATLTGVTQTIHIGDTTPAGTGKTNITIGNANANAGGLTLNSGTGGISFEVAGTGTTGYIQIGTTTGKATPDLFVVDAGTGDPATTTNGSMYYNSSSGFLRCYTAGAWGNCAASAATTTAINNVSAASGNSSIDSTNRTISWNWSTLTTQRGLTFDSTSTGLTTGGILAIGSATSAFNHGNVNETGSELTVTFGDSTNGTATSTTNGLYINPEINVTAGASGVKSVIGINTAAPTLTACTGGSTCNYTGAQINLSANTSASINQTGLAITSAGSSSAGSVIGIDIGNIAAGAATSKGIRIGSGYTNDIEFVDTTAVIRMPDAGSLVFQEAGASTTIAALKEYFSGANYGTFEANGFINIDGSYFEDNFTTQQINATADVVAPTALYGDYRKWVFDEAGTGPTNGSGTQMGGCAVSQNLATLVGNNGSAMGMLQIVPDTGTYTNASNDFGCRLHMGTGTGTSTAAQLVASKRYVQYWKVRPSANFTQGGAAGQTSRYMFWGANNYSQVYNNEMSVTNTNSGGIWMGNIRSTATNLVGGTVWSGFVRDGTNIETLDCTQNILTGTAQFALLRIEARDTNDVHFFVDNDVSNGISLSECGAGITSTNIPTFAMGANMMVLHATNAINGATNQVTYFVDLYAHVQDDRRDTAPAAGPAVAGATTDTAVSDSQPPSYDPITGADVAEQYVFSDSVSSGDIVSLGDSPGEARPSSIPNDRKLLGVVSESPGLVLGQADTKSLPVAVSGRVKVRVNGSGGPIRIGDPITSSDTPGVGMRAANPGKIIGTAMEDYDGAGETKIMVNVNTGYYLGDEGDTALIEQNRQITLGPSVLSSATDSAGLGSATDSATLTKTRLSYTLQNLKEAAVGNLTVLGDTVMKGGSQFLGLVKFNALVEFFDTVVFHGNVSIAGHIEVDHDSAGYAVVKKGQRFVDISFDKEYENKPVINASVTLPRVDEVSFAKFVNDGFCTQAEGPDTCQDKLANELLGSNLGFAVQGKNNQGFMILLNRSAPVDITFSWQALAVKNVKTAMSDVPSDLRMPFDGAVKITTKFGERSSDGGISHQNDQLGMKGHDGVDFALPEKTPVYAADDGVVEAIPDGVEGYGETLIIKHSWGKTYYGHLSEKDVRVGQAVKKGDKIGLSGSTGISTGPHLHFGIELVHLDKNNGYLGKIDPMFFLSGNVLVKNQAVQDKVPGFQEETSTPSSILTPTPIADIIQKITQDVAGVATDSAGQSP